MKLVRFNTGDGIPRIGVVRGEGVVALDDMAVEFPTVRSIIDGGSGALHQVTRFVAESPHTVPMESMR